MHKDIDDLLEIIVVCSRAVHSLTKVRLPFIQQDLYKCMFKIKNCADTLRKLDEIKLDKFLFENVDANMKVLEKQTEECMELIKRLPDWKDDIARLWGKITDN